VRSALNFLYREEPVPDSLTTRLSQAAGRYVTDAARNTTLATATRYGKSVARVPSGLETCGYCLMLCSRGFVYANEATALAASHSGCDCMAIAADTKNRYDREVLEGYDPEWLKEVWDDITHTVGDTNTNAVTKEMARRDPAWIWKGIVPKIDSEPKELLDTIRRKRPWEERTALRLAKHGYKTTFIVDSRNYYDEQLGLWQRVGLSDTKQGAEFKAIVEARGGSSIDSALRNASHKEGVRFVVVDNSEAKYLTDEETERHIRRHMQKRRITNIVMVRHDESLMLIK
jgi:hypothetical protein